MKTPASSKSATQNHEPTSSNKKVALVVCAGQDNMGVAVAGRSRVWQHDQYYTDDMLVAISKILATAGKSPADLSGVVVFSGPGSFTGLRVGITIANGFGRALGIGVRAVDEFQLTKKWWPQLDWVITPSTRTEIILGNRDGFTPMKPEAVAKKIRTGERVCLTTPGLLSIMHPFIKRAGTIRVAPVRTTERLELLSQFSTPKKYRQVLPQYGREPSITLPSKKR